MTILSKYLKEDKLNIDVIKQSTIYWFEMEKEDYRRLMHIDDVSDLQDILDIVLSKIPGVRKVDHSPFIGPGISITISAEHDNVGTQRKIIKAINEYITNGEFA